MSERNGDNSPNGLHGLLTTSKNAQEYFSTLPDYVQKMIVERRNNIKSEDELHRYADIIMPNGKWS